MSGDRFNVFARPSPPQDARQPAETADLARSALAPPARAFLAQRLEQLRARARYAPGDTLDTVAFRAGAIAELEDLLALSDPTPGAATA